MDTRNMTLQEMVEYWKRFSVKKYRQYQKYLRDVSGIDIKNMGLLQYCLRAKRFEKKVSITHLAMILGCSRTQYNRMERNENRFKDEPLDLLAALYGEDASTYKDMQDVDSILKVTGFYDNKERAVRLMKMAFQFMTPAYDENDRFKDFSVVIPKDINEFKPCSNETREKSLNEIIVKLKERFKHNDDEMTEIGKTLTKMKDTTEREKATLRQHFHLLEDEQISIQRLIDKLNGWLKPKEKSE